VFAAQEAERRTPLSSLRSSLPLSSRYYDVHRPGRMPFFHLTWIASVLQPGSSSQRAKQTGAPLATCVGPWIHDRLGGRPAARTWDALEIRFPPAS
jgi:hypothetical protein